ncbi:hypothetical protein [Rhizobium sp. SL42]|uniref:hypothetical protein n=1 Tax=Rhizobium sp. SL42 TaxID=2806346 RepID=UPI001F1F8C63|nr:hypothetical protein [Rhizobium sp. SL42]
MRRALLDSGTDLIRTVRARGYILEIPNWFLSLRNRSASAQNSTSSPSSHASRAQ